jgi:Transposase DDE domain
MNHESLTNAEWLSTIERLGGAALLEQEAREAGAFARARKVECALDQLRLVLAYCWGWRGLRLTAAWAEAIGLAALSNVALLKRLRKSADWLERLVGRLIGTGRRQAGLAGAGLAAKGRPVRLVDATSVAKAGRTARETGGRWRIHSVFDLASESFTVFELTDESEAEVIDRAAVVAGEIRVCDRAYLQADRIVKVRNAGADIIVRAGWNNARWRDSDGERLDLIALLKKARGKQFVDQPIWIKGSAKEPLALRLVAIRKPKQQRDLATEKLKRHARDKGRNLQTETLLAAEWVILVTSLDRDQYPLQAISDLYRLRWRIEIAFKHLKSGVGLVGPPGEDTRSAKAHILCHLLLALLTEPLIADYLGDSPRQEAA